MLPRSPCRTGAGSCSKGILVQSQSSGRDMAPETQRLCCKGSARKQLGRHVPGKGSGGKDKRGPVDSCALDTRSRALSPGSQDFPSHWKGGVLDLGETKNRGLRLEAESDPPFPHCLWALSPVGPWKGRGERQWRRAWLLASVYLDWSPGCSAHLHVFSPCLGVLKWKDTGVFLLNEEMQGPGSEHSQAHHECPDAVLLLVTRPFLGSAGHMVF